jgi:hypothetical protein
MRRRREQSHGHSVHFYESGRELQRRVGSYLNEGILSGASVLAICTTGSRLVLAETLRVTAAGTDGVKRYTALDSRAFLPGVMKGPTPNWPAFRKSLAPLLATAAAEDRPVRIYGDIVAQLWAAGAPGAALELEEFWNRLASYHPFQLLCGYPLSLFRNRPADLFLETCGTHDEVLVNAA